MRFFLRTLIASTVAISGISASAQTLEETVRRAIAHHPSLEQARLDIDLAQEDVLSARAGRSVRVSASLSSAIQSVGTDRAFAIDSGETFINQGQIEAVLPLYTSGALSASIEQARLLVDASEYAFEASKDQIELGAISAHLNAIDAREAVSIRERNTERLAKQYTAAQDRFEIGVLTRTDVALSDARHQAALAGLAAAMADLDAARAQYVELTGTAPDMLAEPSGKIVLPVSLDDAFAQARENNPRLVQLRILERVAELGVLGARSQRGITLEAFGTAGVQEGNWQNDFTDTSATVGLRAAKPLYSGGALLSEERQALVRREQARVQTRLAENQLVRDLSSAWAREQASQTALEAARREVEAARIALEGAEVEVGVGLRTTLDLLDQEQDLLEAQLRLIGARKNVYISQYQIRAFMGSLTL